MGTRHTCNFLTNHTRVLMAIEREPTIRVRDLASLVRVTERGVQAILTDLIASDCVTRIRVGRRNRYIVHRDAALADPRDTHLTVQDVLRMTPEPVTLDLR